MLDLMCRWPDLGFQKQVNARLSGSCGRQNFAFVVYQGRCPAVWLVTEDCLAAMTGNHHGRLPIVVHLGIDNAA
jgi:hypothetical protein